MTPSSSTTSSGLSLYDQLFNAIREESEKKVEKLLEKSIPINQQDPDWYDRTLLDLAFYYASQSYRIAIPLLLIYHGADMDVTEHSRSELKHIPEHQQQILLSAYESQFSSDSEDSDYEYEEPVYSDFQEKPSITREVEEMNGQAVLGEVQYGCFPRFFVPHFRGVHFFPSQDRKTRKRSRKQNEVGKNVYSSAAWELHNKEQESLERCGRIVQKTILGLKQKKQNSRGYWSGARQFPSYFEMHLQRYINSYQAYHKELKAVFNRKKSPAKSLFRVFDFTSNPNLSTSDDPVLAVKYGTGMNKVFGDKNVLTPEYSVDGRPRHPYLGKAYILLHSPQDLHHSGAAHVVSMFAQDRISPQNAGSRNYLAGRETTFFGYIYGDQVVGKHIIRVPNFSLSYRPWMLKKYDLSEQRYNVLKNECSKLRTPEDQESFLKKVLDHILTFEGRGRDSRLMKVARKKAEEMGGLILHQGLEGEFTFEFPDLEKAKELRTPPGNEPSTSSAAANSSNAQASLIGTFNQLSIAKKN